jgi:hypothetical protein
LRFGRNNLSAVRVANANAATLIGAVVHGLYLFPDTATIVSDAGTPTIANGTVFNFGRRTFTTATFSNTEITVTNTGGLYSTASFNGVDLSFVSGPAITSVVEDPASSSLFAPGSVLTFTANDIRLNLSGTCGACARLTAYSIILDVTTTPTVPLPTTLPLFATGLGALGLLGWRRKKKTAAG